MYYINKILVFGFLSLCYMPGVMQLQAQTSQSGQGDSVSVPLPDSIATEYVNWEKPENAFSSDGIYYEYTGGTKNGVTSYNQRISRPEWLLGYMLGKGIPVREAWYKPYSSSCSPPGSKMAMSVIVPAKLVIRTSSPVSRGLAASARLTRMQSPSMGSCAYNIKHYRLFGSGD